MTGHDAALIAVIFVSLAFGLGIALGRSIERQLGKKDDSPK